MAVEWFEEYGCGCISDFVPRKRDLQGYCGTHGNDRIGTVKLSGPAKAIQYRREMFAGRRKAAPSSPEGGHGG